MPALCAHRETPPGFRPGGRPTFFASPKKVGKERRPPLRCPWPAAMGPLRCSVPGAGGPNSLRSRSSLRSDMRAEPEVDRALRALAPGPCASRQLQGGPQQPTAEQPVLPPVRRFLAVGNSAVGCSPSVAAEQRSGLGRARSALPLLDQGGRSNGESAANAVRSALPPQAVSSTGHPRPQAGDSAVGACSLPTFLHTSKKVGRLPGRNPGGVFRSELSKPSRADTYRHT